MKEIFMFLLASLPKFGSLTRVHFYDGDFSSLELTSGDKKYSISVRCEEIKEEAQGDKNV